MLLRFPFIPHRSGTDLPLRRVRSVDHNNSRKEPSEQRDTTWGGVLGTNNEFFNGMENGWRSAQGESDAGEEPISGEDRSELFGVGREKRVVKIRSLERLLAATSHRRGHARLLEMLA